MRVWSTTGHWTALARRWALALVFCAFAGGVSAAAPLFAGPDEQSGGGPAAGDILKANGKCLKCHSKEKFKPLGDGAELALQVNEARYLGSAHGAMACVGCHLSIGSRKHPSRSTNITISNQRDYSVELNRSCRACHQGKYTQYEGSIHASLVGQGSAVAPVCTDCHSAHAIETMAVYQPVTGLPCKKCHADIYEAYAASIHGRARQSGKPMRESHIQAPICADCHRAHDVTAVAVNDGLRSTCMGCHDQVQVAHDQWLPNAGLHLEVVSCAACHAPVAARRIDLQLYDTLARAPVGQGTGHESVQQRLLAMEAGEGRVGPAELAELVRQDRPQGQSSDVRLRGRMEASSGVQAHALADSGSAVRDCDSCHESGSEAFRNVTISVSRPDGRALHYPADTEILASAVSVDPTSDFYAPGGARMQVLDILLLLALAGGFAIPIGHFTMGRIIRKRKHEGEK